MRTYASSWRLASFSFSVLLSQNSTGRVNTSAEMPRDLSANQSVKLLPQFFNEVIKYCYDVAQKMPALISALSSVVPCC